MHNMAIKTRFVSKTDSRYSIYPMKGNVIDFCNQSLYSELFVKGLNS